MKARSRVSVPKAAAEHDPVQDAQSAALRYVTDEQPGIERKAVGKRFRYLDVQGHVVRDAATLERIRLLAIPPAWTDVWICPLAHGHLQATGRDARGRKQYRYHARWRAVRDEAKYERMLAFAAALPRIRRAVSRDLKLPDMPRRKVLAALVRLLETTLIRVGNEEYARENHSFGLTTMRNRHAKIRGSTVEFHFRGKSGKKHDIRLIEPRLARIIRHCQELPGHELFEYYDDEGQVQPLGSGDVNDYLREITGAEFTAKDFRTWAGTIFAAQALAALEACPSPTQGKRAVNLAVKQVAQRLGNTPAICRKCYIHPAVVEAYFDGSLLRISSSIRLNGAESAAMPAKGIENSVRGFLEARLRAAARVAKAG